MWSSVVCVSHCILADKVPRLGLVAADNVGQTCIYLVCRVPHLHGTLSAVCLVCTVLRLQGTSSAGYFVCSVPCLPGTSVCSVPCLQCTLSAGYLVCRITCLQGTLSAGYLVCRVPCLQVIGGLQSTKRQVQCRHQTTATVMELANTCTSGSVPLWDKGRRCTHCLLSHVHSPYTLKCSGNARTHAPAGHPTVAQRTHAHSMHLTIITSPPGGSQGLNKTELTSTPPWLPWPSSLAISPAMEGYWNTLSRSLEVVDRTRSRQRRVWMRVAQSFKLLLAASLIFNFKSPAWEVPGSLPRCQTRTHIGHGCVIN